MRTRWIKPLRNQNILEIGVGTGKNLPYYHPSNKVIAIDRSKNMLKEAHKRREKLRYNPNISLLLQENTPWKLPDKVYSMIVATFVFCTMEDPSEVLNELTYWTESGCRVILFEFTNSTSKLTKTIFKMISPLSTKIFGVNFNRKPTHTYIDKNWKIVKITQILSDWIIVVELLRI